MPNPDFRALCSTFVSAVDQLMSRGDSPSNPGSRLILTADILDLEDLAETARAALAQPAPEPPTDEELLRLYQVATPCYEVKEYQRELDFARAVLARWGQGNG